MPTLTHSPAFILMVCILEMAGHRVQYKSKIKYQSSHLFPHHMGSEWSVAIELLDYFSMFLE